MSRYRKQVEMGTVEPQTTLLKSFVKRMDKYPQSIQPRTDLDKIMTPPTKGRENILLITTGILHRP